MTVCPTCWFLSRYKHFHETWSEHHVNGVRPTLGHDCFLPHNFQFIIHISSPFQSTLIGSTVQDVVFSIPHFAVALLRNKPHRYVFFEKINAGMKFTNRKKFRYIPVHFEHMYINARNDLSLCSTYYLCE